MGTVEALLVYRPADSREVVVLAETADNRALMALAKVAMEEASGTSGDPVLDEFGNADRGFLARVFAKLIPGFIVVDAQPAARVM